MNDAELIESFGGAAALARRLGYKNPDGARRVHNWKSRGIPAQVRLAHPSIFRKSKAKLVEVA
jgi:hypothetical protein